MSIMETREALEEAQTEEEVARIRDENRGASSLLFPHLSVSPVHALTTPPRAVSMRETFDTLARVLGAESTGTDHLEQAKNLLIRLKYLENVEGVCREWSPGKRVELSH